MKISIIHSVIFSAIFCVSAQANESAWSAKSTDAQGGNTFSSSTKSSLAANSNVPEGPSIAAKTTPQSQAAKRVNVRPAQRDVNYDYWVYDAYVTLHTDSDYDGYYHHFSVVFDVDSIYHTTSDFYIGGDSTQDQITVETELLSGFYPDDYEVLIEIYDAYSNELVAVYDGYSDADLYLLSIESQDKEVIYVEPDVVVIEASGGSAAWLALLLLPILLVRLANTNSFRLRP